MKAPEVIETARLKLTRPSLDDGAEIFGRYASSREVTKYIGFRAHLTLDDTRSFLIYSEVAWRDWPAGPYLIRLREGGALVGGTGLHFETPARAMTGYILAKDAWGRGYATEALQAMVGLAPRVGVRRLYALCHPDHAASYRVLEKCGFVREGILRKYLELPNLTPGELFDALSYSMIF